MANILKIIFKNNLNYFITSNNRGVLHYVNKTLLNFQHYNTRNIPTLHSNNVQTITFA